MTMPSGRQLSFLESRLRRNLILCLHLTLCAIVFTFQANLVVSVLVLLKVYFRI